MPGALDVVGIDFSVQETDISDWLATPEFASYPALAEALLRDSREIDYVPVPRHHRFQLRTDVVPSPPTVESVRSRVLEAAVVEGWNTRYGEQLSSFTELLAAPDRDYVQATVRAEGEIWRMGRTRHEDPS